MSLAYPVEPPEFRYISWGNLPGDIQLVSSTDLDYNETTWNNPSTNGIEEKSFSELTKSEEKGAKDIGFTQESWDCWVNHYSDFFWTELESMELVQYLQVLGWDEDSWSGDKAPPDTDLESWAGLSSSEKDAAANLCYFESVWDGLDLTNAEFRGPSIDATVTPYRFSLPPYRYMEYGDLPSDVRRVASVSLDYNKHTWNSPATNEVETKAFSSLDSSEQSGATTLGFTELTWDCWVNHYTEYEWTEMENEGVATFWESLGWDEYSWNGDAAAPASDDKYWHELDDSEKAGAQALCYFESLWNGLELTDNSFEVPSDELLP